MSMIVAALIVAAGRGTRAASAGEGPKQYARIGGEMVLTRTLRPFCTHARIGPVQVVVHADDRPLYDAAAAPFRDRLLPPVTGGARRQDSVRHGLEALALGPRPPDAVLIHDAARPFVTELLIDRVLDGLPGHAGAIPAIPLADTLKRARSDGRTIASTVPREGLFRAQTPQAFQFQRILSTHRTAAAGAAAFTDDAALLEAYWQPVVLVAGAEDNRKLTTAEDIMAADRQLSAGAASFETRTGQGFDVHRFCPGDHVWLGGVRIPHTAGLEGHSDADVALHALTDALLGAIGDGDIGQHFPPGDPQWKGARSHRFLSDAAARVRTRGGSVVNVDVTLLCEAPRIAPHRESMRARTAEILGISIDRVAVKATTTEGLGFTGRHEGIAAMAVAAVRLPLA